VRKSSKTYYAEVFFADHFPTGTVPHTTVTRRSYVLQRYVATTHLPHYNVSQKRPPF